MPSLKNAGQKRINNMKKVFIISMLLTAMVACSNNAKQEEEVAPFKDEAPVESPVQATSGGTDTLSATSHNAQNSLDVDGTYKGILPCADCNGIETELTLKKGMTFRLSSKYIGKSETASVIEGNYTWKDGSSIKLDLGKKAPGLYLVKENALVHLDEEGRIIKGPLSKKYILTKN